MQPESLTFLLPPVWHISQQYFVHKYESKSSKSSKGSDKAVRKAEGGKDSYSEIWLRKQTHLVCCNAGEFPNVQYALCSLFLYAVYLHISHLHA